MCFVQPSCLEDISLFRAILKLCTPSSGQWKSNLKFPLTQLLFSSTQTPQLCITLLCYSRQKAKQRQMAIIERCETKIFEHFNNFASNITVFLPFTVNISTRSKWTFACGCYTRKPSAMFFFVLVNHLPNSS